MKITVQIEMDTNGLVKKVDAYSGECGQHTILVSEFEPTSVNETKEAIADYLANFFDID